jgi:hypothetical protein
MPRYEYYDIDIEELSSADLRKEAAWLLDPANPERDPDISAYRVTIDDEAGERTERAQALYSPRAGRLGIAWGADASWADVPDVEAGIEMWLTDPDAWEIHA